MKAAHAANYQKDLFRSLINLDILPQQFPLSSIISIFLFNHLFNVTVQALLKTMRLLCITASVGRSRSVKNAADTTALFKAHLYSNAQKALQESGGPEL